jgi:hypothetical protein
MRLPRTLLTVTFLVVCVGLSIAADGPRAESNATAPVGVIRAPKTADSAALLPEMFIPPHAWQKAELSGSQPKPDSADRLCYNIHSVVVAEDDHTGVTHTVRESTCTRATRFQMKNTDAPAK